MPTGSITSGLWITFSLPDNEKMKLTVSAKNPLYLKKNKSPKVISAPKATASCFFLIFSDLPMKRAQMYVVMIQMSSSGRWSGFQAAKKQPDLSAFFPSFWCEYKDEENDRIKK